MGEEKRGRFEPGKMKKEKKKQSDFILFSEEQKSLHFLSFRSRRCVCSTAATAKKEGTILAKMTRYYCDYCDAHLTHDSVSVSSPCTAKERDDSSSEAR